MLGFVLKTTSSDARLDALAKLAGSKKVLYSQLEFVDIAGLVRGAAEGKGLGNKFLGWFDHLRVVFPLKTCLQLIFESVPQSFICCVALKMIRLFMSKRVAWILCEAKLISPLSFVSWTFF